MRAWLQAWLQLIVDRVSYQLCSIAMGNVTDTGLRPPLQIPWCHATLKIITGTTILVPYI